MAEPLRSRLRPATSPGGLTSPDPVTAPHGPSAHRHNTPAWPKTPGTSRTTVSGTTNTPTKTTRSRSSSRFPGNDHPSPRGGLRLSPAPTASSLAGLLRALWLPDDCTRQCSLRSALLGQTLAAPENRVEQRLSAKTVPTLFVHVFAGPQAEAKRDAAFGAGCA